jgi:hypothetical protein
MRNKRQAGQTLLPVVFGMVVFGGVLGLAIDVGFMRYLKREIQTAVDSAAIAGAAEINYGDYAAAAKADAAANGFTDGANGVTVTVNNPPASGPNQGQAGYVEVVLSKVQPTFFMRIVPGVATSATVVARAVAYQGSARGCIYSLQPSPGAIAIGTVGRRGGGADLNANCAVMDNGDFTLRGRADVISASAIGVTGSFFNGTRSNVTPTPQQGMVSAADPLAYLPTQNPGNCNFTNVSITGGNRILSQGVYCGGINISGNANVTFNPGLYVMEPSGLTNNGLTIGGAGNITGSGVTFYNGANSSSVSITNTGTVTLTAPTTGTYAGILIFQDPNNGHNATVDGGNNPTFQGALYFPNLDAILTIDNIGNNAAYTILVAGSLDVRGNNNTLGSDYSSLANGSPIKDAVLVE